MTDDQALQMIAYEYSQNVETAAVGTVLGQMWTYLIVAVILLLVIVFFLAIKRN